MPFTFSHPAAVLPATYLPKRYYSLTGLIIGSMTPDFEYFMRLSVKSLYSHTWAGLFWFDLPLGLLAAFVFHDVIRDPLYFNTPLFQRRLLPFTTFRWNLYFRKNWMVVLLSILVGGATHILWDSLTHRNRLIPALNTIYIINGNPLTVFEMLQRFSTVLGGAIVLYAFYKLPPVGPRSNNIQPAYWISFAVTFFLILIGRAWYVHGIQSVQEFAVVGIGAFFASLIIAPLLTKRLLQYPGT